MARPLRIDFPGAWQHVMNRGAGRRAIFLNRRHRLIFLDLLADITEIYRVEIHSFCLMGNHYHLLIRTPEGGLSHAMRHLDSVYAQRFNHLIKTDGPLFRGRFKSVLVDSDAYLLQVSRYIHLNPIDANLVESAIDFEWSSYRYYVGAGGRPPWLHIKTVLNQLGDEDQHNRYREFLESADDPEVGRFYRNVPLEPILGRPAFRRRIDEFLGASSSDPEVPNRVQVLPRPTLKSIVRAVSLAFGVRESELLQLGHRHSPVDGSARGAVIHLTRRMAGCRISDVAAGLGYRSYAGASSALRRLEAAMESDSALRAKVDAARALMHQDET